MTVKEGVELATRPGTFGFPGNDCTMEAEILLSGSIYSVAPQGNL